MPAEVNDTSNPGAEMEQINITFLDACENHSCVFVRSGFFSFCAKLIASNPDPLEKK